MTLSSLEFNNTFGVLSFDELGQHLMDTREDTPVNPISMISFERFSSPSMSFPHGAPIPTRIHSPSCEDDLQELPDFYVRTPLSSPGSGVGLSSATIVHHGPEVHQVREEYWRRGKVNQYPGLGYNHTEELRSYEDGEEGPDWVIFEWEKERQERQ